MLLFSNEVNAVPVDNLYDAEVLVTSESDRQLRQGARAGLLQVLVKVSGNLEVESSSLVRSALRNPSDYYYQFSYESSDRSVVVDGEEVPAKTLKVAFDPSAVARLLREANLPVWGSNRPGVLVWVATTEGAERLIVREDDATALVDSLSDQASQRGVPLLFPILDLEDASRISPAEVWGAFLDRIGDASGRYNPDVILTGRGQEEGPGRWAGRWSYKVSGQWQTVESVAFSEDELVRDVVNLLADELASRYALGSSRGRVSMQIEGVTGLEQYAAISEYLETLTPVTQSSVVGLEADRVAFELQTEGQYEQLIKIIELDERMVLLNQSEGGATLRYRWIE